MRDWEEWRPTSPRARTAIGLVAVATAIGVLLAMLQPQLRLLRAQGGAAPDPMPGAPAAAADGCGAPGAAGCPGGKLDVFVVPAEPAPRR